MFVIPCKHTEHSPIDQCVNSILQFHPTELIAIVDSNSNDISYFNQFSQYSNVKLLTGNSNYEVGALWKAYEQYQYESAYVLFQDSMILKRSISKFIDDDKSYAFLYFDECTDFNHSGFSNFFQNTQYNFPGQLTQSIPCCFGSNCILKKDIMNKFIEKKLNLSFLPTNKTEHQHSERMIAFCMKEEGVNLHENNLDGNCLSDWNKFYNDGHTYIKKLFVGRN